MTVYLCAVLLLRVRRQGKRMPLLGQGFRWVPCAACNICCLQDMICLGASEGNAAFAQ